MKNLKMRIKYSIYGVLTGSFGMMLLQVLFYHIVYRGLKYNYNNSNDFYIVITVFMSMLCVLSIIKLIQYNSILKNFFKKYCNNVYTYIFLWGFAGGILIWSSFKFKIDEVLFRLSNNICLIILYYSLAGMVIELMYNIYTFIHTKQVKEEGRRGSVFFHDVEITNVLEDKFFGEKVDSFTEFIQKQRGPFVFGIEGPWGVGKSSFINLCCQKLENNNLKDVVIYNFNPLKYENSKDVLNKFYIGLIKKINERHFEPELNAIIISYMEQVLSALSIQPIGGISIKYAASSKSEDEIFLQLKNCLQQLSYEIVIIIDDLDRLDFATVKKILFLMRNIFHFPHIKFVICYDIQNIIWSAKAHMINVLNDTDEKIPEFMDKYIDSTYHMYLSAGQIKDYLYNLCHEFKDKSVAINDKLWETCINGINYILLQEETFQYYKTYFSSPRKIKRLVNQFIRISSVKNENILALDFDGTDLINLLLIYVYYPLDFKDICDAEMGKKRGTYALTDSELISMHIYNPAKFNEKIKEHKNIVEEKIKSISNTEQFLFKQLFLDKKILKNIQGDNYYNRACYNFSQIFGYGNLENYLRLIISPEKSVDKNENALLYVNIVKNDIVKAKDVRDIENIFKRNEINTNKLWTIIVNFSYNNIYTLSTLVALIKYAVSQLQYAKFSLNGNGSHEIYNGPFVKTTLKYFKSAPA